VTDPVVQPGPDDDWQQKIIADAIARGYRVSVDEPDAILLASARADLAGHPLRRLAEAMADDLQAHASQPVSRGTCAALARAAACAGGLAVTGADATTVYTTISLAAAILEMRAAP
jgi:hypothetical protein